MPGLSKGLYELLITAKLQQWIDNPEQKGLSKVKEVDHEEIHNRLGQYLAQVFTNAFSQLRGEGKDESRQQLLNDIYATLGRHLGKEQLNENNLRVPLQILTELRSKAQEITGVSKNSRPDTPLAFSALLTGSRQTPSLLSQLEKEIQSADRVDLLVSFIRWSGLVNLMRALKELTETATSSGDPRLRIITTSYMGATEPRAIEELLKLPNTKVKISYDTNQTRLHAKAYLIHRNTDFGSAYVGSANVSKAAHTEGLEWMVKISQYELPNLWQQVVATFDSYWSESEFEDMTQNDLSTLRLAIKDARKERIDHVPVHFDLNPTWYQREILDQISAERENLGKHKHLIVAATGTGKTMLAAFDYKRFAAQSKSRPSLLYIVHREEILRQALETFRAVLKDPDFGDLVAGGSNPNQDRHLFCTIQSWNSRDLDRLPPDFFQFVIMDEAHHLAADSYQRLMNHIKPEILLGLTATPERSDNKSILPDFGNSITAEIRLPDAINQGLLCPFRYFGVNEADGVDFSGMAWQRGGYRIEDLDRILTGNDIRAKHVLERIRYYIADADNLRGLGFCVSKNHAEYMAKRFTEWGVLSRYLTSDSSREERAKVKGELSRGDIRFVFTVDLYNEGVDIPEIDTVLFLRPTESLTVYLQQLGRGLRKKLDKPCLTVLDFIAPQHRSFRFVDRFRAMTTEPIERVDRQILDRFPYLPAGCSIQLERIAQERILENIGNTLGLNRPKIIMELKKLYRSKGRPPSLTEAMDCMHIDLVQLLKKDLFSRLLASANAIENFEEPNEDRLKKAMPNIGLMDDFALLRFLSGWLSNPNPSLDQLDEWDRRRLAMLHWKLWDTESKGWTLPTAELELRRNPRAREDLQRILAYRLKETAVLGEARTFPIGPLHLHASYSSKEVLLASGHKPFGNSLDFREGVLALKDQNKNIQADLFFVTLQKTEAKFSPTTMYEDYFISDHTFHWQSQSNTTVTSETGKRYLNHGAMQVTPYLFVREEKTLENGMTAPFTFLGPLSYLKHEGSAPISITWELLCPLPARFLRRFKKAA